MTRLFIDSTVPLFAVGLDHPHREAAKAVLRAAAAGTVELHGSAEVVQEFVFHRLRRGDRHLAVEQARELAETIVIHPFDRTVAGVMLDLVGATALRGRDAVHAATALVHGFDHIVSADADFEGLASLRRVELGSALD